ncbi:FGGY-family carbohydrate kinase [Labrys wisconsinensis]|uniref:Sugar (Pentulose or hexulose) kinase n=1 Tax=Labrys wisconsinensis TaxID=425677 RepID=A0ABU0J4Y2_9HYPH|nr:sugar kinase [Labrys wisconsinensis]MDQ0468242.1 sugar (pentulose or hexulose) kinase [Labrys wisconsinensis]
MPVTAVLDVGKTNVKLVIFAGARVLWQRSVPNAPLPGPPYPHADVELVWRFALEALREAAAACSVDALVVTTHGASAALVDDEGLVLPVMDYEFAGLDAMEPDYAPFRPPFAQTLSPPISGGLNYGKQVFYQETRHPQAFARARHLLMYPQYYAWRFTGIARNEVTSLGSHGDAWLPREGRPSSLVERRGWQRLLPPVVPAFSVIGPVKPEIAAATGLRPDVRVFAGAHDSNASILPHLLTIEPPFTVVSTGTWVVIMAVGASTDGLDPKRDSYSNVDVLGRPLPTAKFMGGREFAVILDGAPPQADAEDLAAVLAAGAMILPAFVPNGGPFEGRHGRIEGTLPDRPGARAAIATLYAALVTDFQLDVLGAARGPLPVEGSFAANPLYCAVLAALRPGQPVLLALDTAGTAFGASLLATWPQVPARPPLAEAAPLADAQALLRYRARWRAAVAGA